MDIYKVYNGSMDAYEEKLEEIKNIKEKTQDSKDAVDEFFHHTAKLILRLVEFNKEINGEYFKNSIEKLRKDNNSLYDELVGKNYDNSYSNPTFAVERLGDGIGQVFCAFYNKYLNYVDYIFKGKLFKINELNEFFIKVYNNHESEELSYEKFKYLMGEHVTGSLEVNNDLFFKETYNLDFDFYTNIVMESDLNDLSYLFKYGKYISDNEINTAKFLNGYEEEKIDTLSDSIVKAYIEGFVRDNKDITKRHNVRIVANVGQERITREIIKKLKDNNLNGFVAEVQSTEYNKQFDYDHKFDNAIYLNSEYEKSYVKSLKSQVKENEEKLKDYSGILFIERFGEEPFSPSSKKERLKLSDDQLGLYQNMRNELRKTIEEYIPEKERSFCIVAFPTPDIGNNFEEIFEEIIKINMLDNNKYERIQQHIIDALDKGEFVHIKGKDGNTTDIYVKMHEIKNPEKETNFVNCVADVNIPLGEVFTSPILRDTNGILHVEDIYLDGFRYYNLKLKFQDGYITEYSCTNFKKEEENKEYIKENLIFPHNTLPLGEFAIGTNTLAYVIAKKYDIMDKLPILIIEKMGPHFAVGDTCFSWAEDTPVYNFLDKKEIIARDNEKSLLRKTNINEAYTNCHTDITLPYESLDTIVVISKDKEEIEIIRDGRFVLEGTEELNEPFGA
ncbi:MAG: aminopeptidase [Anaeromicrobium sp.]|uniref:aminopeptidase n=1 Tax=Anaeromicrobium sp. TaxID=1929132 RepID=UPI0025D20609|nr:aminopeptidase [Anaeromicrobium sp.]MCT4593904.1 aminopeptidase [Anaeromicrobium sp.]